MRICTNCKIERTDDQFISKAGRTNLKTCSRCRDIKKKSRLNKLCNHGKSKNHCKDCGGSSICVHNIQRNRCVKCDGKSICEHKRLRYRCKECNGISICIHNREQYNCIDCSGKGICEHKKKRCNCKICGDALDITIKNIIRNSRKVDKMKGIYDSNMSIDYCFVAGLFKEYSKCYYCYVKMQTIEFKSDMATIERIDNSLGHIKTNCVLACHKCNISKRGKKY